MDRDEAPSCKWQTSWQWWVCQHRPGRLRCSQQFVLTGLFVSWCLNKASLAIASIRQAKLTISGPIFPLWTTRAVCLRLSRTIKHCEAIFCLHLCEILINSAYPHFFTVDHKTKCLVEAPHISACEFPDKTCWLVQLSHYAAFARGSHQSASKSGPVLLIKSSVVTKVQSQPDR